MNPLFHFTILHCIVYSSLNCNQNSQEKVVYANTYVVQHVHFHDHTYSYKQSYKHESCQNEISTYKSIDSAQVLWF